jgi:putative PIN family toxin of toxin-antitoxin system
VRVVFDTNIYISAFVIPGGVADEAINLVIDGFDTLLISGDIIDELLTKLAMKFSKDTEELSRIAIFLNEITDFVEGQECISILDDDADNRILECGVSGKADLIVTGDKVLQRLKKFRDIKIVSLREYIEHHE